MDSKNKDQKTTYTKKKASPALGFRTPDHFRAGKFSPKGNPAGMKFNPTFFKTQHKGGS